VAPTALYALNVQRQPCSAKPATQGEEERPTPNPWLRIPGLREVFGGWSWADLKRQASSRGELFETLSDSFHFNLTKEKPP